MNIVCLFLYNFILDDTLLNKGFLFSHFPIYLYFPHSFIWLHRFFGKPIIATIANAKQDQTGDF